MIIDGSGHSWSRHDPGLAGSLGAALEGEALVRFGVTNLGWIEVGISGESLHLRCRPQMVSPRALAAAFYLLFSQRWRVVALSLLAKTWSFVILRDRNQVVDLLASLTSRKCTSGLGDSRRFLRLPVPAAHSPLARVLRDAVATISGKSLTLERLAAVDRMLKGRWSISHIDSETQQLVFDHMGQGFTRIGPDWAGGAAFAPPPMGISDTSYHQWVAGFRLEVARQADPVFDAVDAWVVGTAQELARLRYHRFTTPVSVSGRRLLLSASTVDLAINLRQAA